MRGGVRSGVAAIGHRHPRVVAAVARQTALLVHGLGDVAAHPARVAELRRQLVAWTDQLQPRGLPADKRNSQEGVWYREYFPPTVTPPTP